MITLHLLSIYCISTQALATGRIYSTLNRTTLKFSVVLTSKRLDTTIYLLILPRFRSLLLPSGGVGIVGSSVAKMRQ